MSLTAGDYAVIALYLVAITAFGSWFAKFQKTTRDYFLADRSSPWWAICFTIVATETSTLSFIGVPAQAYTGAMGFLQLAFGYIVGRVLVSLLFIPSYFRGELVTSYELLQRRFGSPVKTAASAIFLITRSLADGVRLFATALVIAVVTGVPVSWTVILLGGAMIVYTVRGGASAVIWTDVVQMFVYIGGAGLVFWALLVRIPGGWSEVVTTAERGEVRGPEFLHRSESHLHVLGGSRRGVALTLATHGTDQFLVQRLLSARSAKEASLGLILSGFIVFAQFTLFLVIGAMLFTYYQHVPAPALGRADEILPSFVVHTLTGGAAGFIVAAIVAAALSPSINSMAAVTVRDFYVKFIKPDASEIQQMRLARQSTIGWGIVQIGVGLAAQWMDRSVLDAGLAVLSLASGPVLGAFLIGVLTKRVQTGAMLAGMVAGAAVLVVVWWTGAVAWTWYAFTGASVTAIVALVASLVSGDKAAIDAHGAR
jgi:SSS family transporter